MRQHDYKAMLDAIERALQICRESLAHRDDAHRRICDELQAARDRLRVLLQGPRSA